LEHGHIHVADVGTLLGCSCLKPDAESPSGFSALDISGATSKKISFQSPAGTSVERDADFVNDGSDGLLSYSTVADDFNAAGKWYLQGHVVLADGSEFHSDRVVVWVKQNNATPS
jgi:hypothetical protein